MTPLWIASEAVAATGGHSAQDWNARGVSIDSRTVAAGDLFIALVGPRYDGHDFLADALAKGAAAALVSRVPGGVAPEAPLLVVADTQAALEALGRTARRRTAAVVVGVTGSVGKTGTKEALRRAFERQGRTAASAGSLNNQWGVPLSLARMPRDTAFGVFEIGMNHPGEIDALARLMQPEIALITTIEPAHLGFFASVEAIADAKAEIFNGMGPRGAAVLNRDNPHYARLAAAAQEKGIVRILGFGAHPEASVRLIDCHLYATASAVTASVMGEIVDFCIAIPGRHWVMNSLAVLAAVKAAGGDVGAAAASLGAAEAMEGRGKRHKIQVRSGTADLIDESYNASPASMRAAIDLLAANVPEKGGRRIAVLGDMLELGEASTGLHAALAEPLMEAHVDLFFTVGTEMSALHDALPKSRRGAHAVSAAEMAVLLPPRLAAGDVVMVKGSFGSRMREIVARLVAGPLVSAMKG
jgi:UDP-N-acetylmuramoyl-tripeptide--D-alanyl-D-alanine ligase